jgi:hypothetical protein
MNLLEEKTIQIGGKDYKIVMSIRAMMNFEKLSNHSIDQIRTIEDTVMLFYCTVKAGGADLTYDQFLDLIDDKPEAIKAFTETMIEKTEKKLKAR